MGLKEDVDFARFLSIGVYAAEAISQDLEHNHGHRIIKLERCAKANKVRQDEGQRMRLADSCVLAVGSFRVQRQDKA
jgi:malonyl CoA-acyl carrier protein transacylase